METMGTVTPISSVFPAEEAQKASRRVQDTIAERQQQLDQLKGFIDDNISVINLVQKLPDETHHNIMVPFGKAAFFPGRLIHTNEFMVLLGEGYYAERTAKQTVDILKRRGKALETQVESLKAIMQDLEAEASFFDATAQESADGLVEIREDYVEEASSRAETAGYGKPDPTFSLEKDARKFSVEDEEYNRIFSRIDELEKEEEEAEKGNESDEDERIQNEPDSNISEMSTHQEVRSSPVQVVDVAKAPEAPAVSKDGSLHCDYPPLNRSTMSKALELPEEKKKVQAPPSTSNMAFTGSIVEHAHNIGMNMLEQQTGARSSKPVSRFKMQRK
ncbi:RNA polymerase II subunit 5-mediating protein homolog isoform X2 [Sesamum indicum]|uniref:RNA polymerase II subunit 5-mediating protein homolog isoform X2 n=1 Tax=Sesamum indicum TaxID=4182 RepID=A0A6I9TKE4_SESIN|nr:RNA polymerase II subunit 5-mediating protein homolog isoform X2 [Sesamum indicum]